MRSHRYASVGTYTLTITVQGPLNTVIKTFPVLVEDAVKTFNISLPGVTGSPSQIAYTGSECSSAASHREEEGLICDAV